MYNNISIAQLLKKGIYFAQKNCTYFFQLLLYLHPCKSDKCNQEMKFILF